MVVKINHQKDVKKGGEPTQSTSKMALAAFFRT